MENSVFKKIETELTIAIQRTLIELKKDFPKDKFYYFTLTTVGEALSPGHSIWSEELLENESKKQAELYKSDYNIIKEEIKYSYADSPLFYHYKEFFNKVEKLFLDRPTIDDLDSKNWETEFKLRIRTMVNSLKNVENNGYFGIGKERENWFLNVEINPPDDSNLSRARIFNSEKKVKEYLNWYFE